MSYEKLYQTLEDFSPRLGEAALVKFQGPGFESNLSVDLIQIRGFIANHIQKVLEYLRTGNMENWRTYLTDLTRHPLMKNVDTFHLLNLADWLYENISRHIDETFGGPAQATERVKYQRRLESFVTLNKSIMMATRIQDHLKG